MKNNNTDEKKSKQTNDAIRATKTKTQTSIGNETNDSLLQYIYVYASIYIRVCSAHAQALNGRLKKLYGSRSLSNYVQFKERNMSEWWKKYNLRSF